MVTVAKEINCSHCGAPLPVQPGEILVTCKYCGFTSVIETGKPFEFEHSLILNSLDTSQVFAVIRDWMGRSFIGPKDLQKKSTLNEQNLVYLPFWIVSAEARTHYKGVLERIAPPTQQEGHIADRYDWLVLARRQTDFPTRSYHLSLSGKIPFDPMKIDKGAKVLNSEMTADEAVKQTQDEIGNLHEYLAKDKVDKIADIKTDFDVSGTAYLHAPVWFVGYSYRNARYQVFLDGSSGEVIKGEMPTENFKSL